MCLPQVSLHTLRLPWSTISRSRFGYANSPMHPGDAELTARRLCLATTPQELDPFEYRIPHRSAPYHHDVCFATNAEKRMWAFDVAGECVLDRPKVVLLDKGSIIHLPNSQRNGSLERIVLDAGSAMQHQRDIDSLANGLQALQIQGSPATELDMFIADADSQQIHARGCNKACRGFRIGVGAGMIAAGQFVNFSFHRDPAKVRQGREPRYPARKLRQWCTRIGGHYEIKTRHYRGFNPRVSRQFVKYEPAGYI